MNTTDEMIFCYSWDNAVEDGTFTRVPENLQREAGIKYPMAVTTNLFCTHIRPSEADKNLGQSINGRLWDVLWMFRNAAKKSSNDDSMITFEVSFNKGGKSHTVTLWATCEARSPKNPEPVITIMIPEDY